VQFDFIVTSTNKQKYEDEVNSMGGKIYRLHSRARSTLKYIKELNSLFQENPEYKIIHAHSGSANITIDLAVAKKNKIPVRIAHSHNTSCNNQAQHYILKHFLKKWATHSFACSNSAGVWMFGSNTKFDIVKNGIDLSKFCYNNETRSKVRNSLDIDNNLLLISVGALRAAKNQMYLLDIFNEILKINDNAKLLVVGEGSCRGDLEEKIREFNLNNKAYLLGNRNDVNELLQGADAFILPSAYKGQQ
jgi:glycosyltransferase involved in cell wall biosynthesis